MAMAIFGNEINLPLAGLRRDATGRAGTASALQNSDINRAELGALLRRREKDASRGAGGFWRRFMDAQAASCANSNG